MSLWYHIYGRAPCCGNRKEKRALSATRMTFEPDDAEQSVKRIRRGCVFSALIFVALAALFTGTTGNLFYLLLILVAVALLALSRAVR